MMPNVDPGLLHAGIYVASAIAGQLFYAVKQWADGANDAILDQFLSNPRRTVGAVIGNLTAMVAVIAVLPLADMPVSAAVITGFLQGISADSVLNKSLRKPWTTEQREAANGEKP